MLISRRSIFPIASSRLSLLIQQVTAAKVSEAKDIIAFLALCVSFFTLYWTVFRTGRLKVKLGRVMLAQYVPNGSTHLKPEISAINTGATTVVIYNISGSIRRMSDDREENLIWTENLTTEFVEANRSNDTRFQSFPDTILIAKSEAIKQRLLLTTEHPYKFESGDYELKLAIQSDGASRRKTFVSGKMRIRPDDLGFLEKERPVAGAQRGLNLRFVMEYGPNTNCYLSTYKKPAV
jgi:hypothetical protein